jgi:hypothetical protein
MITQTKAEQLVYQHINRPRTDWPDMPEMIIVRVVERPLGWVIGWTSRPAAENPGSSHALAGNAPFLVSREDGTFFPMPYRMNSYEERLRDAESQLQAYLQTKS